MIYPTIRQILLVSLLFLVTCYQTSSAEEGYAGSNDQYTKTTQKEKSGEIIDFVRGDVSFETIDTIIPGNKGMDIVIARSNRISDPTGGHESGYGAMKNWHFEIPRIIIPTLPWGVTRGWQREQLDEAIPEVVGKTRTGICNDPYPGEGRPTQPRVGNIAERYWSGMRLKIPGQEAQQLIKNTDTNIERYPANAKWITTADWIVSCTTDGSGFIVKSPQGITYTMDVLEAHTTYGAVINGNGHGRNTLYASKIEDIHGSVISYTYNSTTNFYELRDGIYLRTKFLLPYYQNNLTQISRNDPSGAQIVEFDYGSALYPFSIDEISINGKTWTYKYTIEESVNGEHQWEKYLDKVIRPDNLFWKYKYEGERSYRQEDPRFTPSYQGPNRLTQVKLPSGGTMDYRYKVFNKITYDSFSENIRLHTKTINDGTADIDQWIFDYKNHTASTVKVTIDRGFDSEVQIYKNDKSFQHGRLLSRSLKRAGADKQVTKYTYAKLAEIGTFTFEDYPKEIPDSLTTKVKLTEKQITQDGNSYLTKYLEHDLYGRPTKIEEKFGSKLKYTKLGYKNETTNWILGLPTTVKVSATDVETDYAPVSETIYHDDITAGGVYDGLGLPYEKKSFDRWIKRFTEYSAEGNLQKVEYNLSRTVGTGNRFTQYTNYKRGIPQTTTMPSLIGTGSIYQTKVVDNNGWITSETDLKNVTTNYKYDELGRGKSIDLAKDTTQNIDWEDTLYTWGEDTSGNSTRTIETCVLDTTRVSCSGTVKFTQVETYDGLLRLTNLSETDGTTTRYKNFNYNRYNQETFASQWSDTDTDTQGVTRTFDGLRRLESLSSSGFGTIDYDYLAGNKIKVTDAEDNITTTTYLAYGAPSYEQAINIASPADVTTTIDIGVLGLTNSITQSGFRKDGQTAATQTETRLYDTYKQLCLVKRKDVGNALYNKNSLGETNWIAEGVSNTDCTTTIPDTAVTYTLDNAGNVKAIDYPDSHSADVIYVRDDNGNLSTLTAGTVVHSYNYNNQNLLEDESFTIGSEKTLDVDYGYTSMMYRDYIEYPDGSTVYSKPDNFGRPTEVKSYHFEVNPDDAESPIETLDDIFASSIEHYRDGQLDSFTYGNGITHKTTLETTSLLPSQLEDLNGSNTIIDLAYTYDNNANIKTITDTQNTAYNLTDLSYDGLDRLTSTTGESGIGSSTISYDSLGNITAYSSKNSVLDYTYDYTKNRLTSVTGTGSQSKNYTNFSYDGRGNITNNSHDVLDFNRANQLYKSGSNSYLYDGFNRRVKQTDAKGTSYSMYSQDGTLLYRETDVVNGSGNGINYIYLGKKLIAKTIESEPSANSRQHYKPYGESIEVPKDDIGYAGHKFDTDLSLSYMQARYYDPVIGRFYSNDPIGFRDVHSFNRYAYANNNPYKYTDPTGNIAESIWDAASLSYGLTSLGTNLWNGNWGAAGVDALGVIADGAALAVPFVPGGAGMAIGASRQGAKAVSKYEVGAFNDLSKRSAVGDKLDIHHAAQKHPASQVIDGYDPKTAPSIAVPAREHRRIPTIKGGYEGNARGLLAKDIKDLRQHTNAPNSALQNLIRLNKESYPSAFIKGK